MLGCLTGCGRRGPLHLEMRWLTAAVILALGLSGYSAWQVRKQQASLEAALLEVLGTLDAQHQRILQLERSALQAPRPSARGALAEAALPSAEPGAVPTSAAPFDAPERAAEFARAIEGRVEGRLRERIDTLAARQEARNEWGEWEPPMDELAGELQLGDAQAEAATEIFNDAHDDMFQLMKTRRADGGSLLDDFAAELRAGKDVEQASRTLVERLLSERIPGMDRTYLEDIMAMRKVVLDNLREHLDEAQMRELETLRIDPLNVKTGHDPTREYVESQLE